jgi:hypothetical protein
MYLSYASVVLAAPSRVLAILRLYKIEVVYDVEKR